MKFYTEAIEKKCVFLRQNNTGGMGRVSFVMGGKPDKGPGTRGRVDRGSSRP